MDRRFAIVLQEELGGIGLCMVDHAGTDVMHGRVGPVCYCGKFKSNNDGIQALISLSCRVIVDVGCSFSL